VKTLGLDCVVRLSKSLGSKKQPACTADIQVVLFNEVKALFAIPAKLNKILETAPNSNNVGHQDSVNGVAG
jgi:hypothetical protein